MLKPSIPDVIERFRAYHKLPQNCVWGSLHVILDDGNFSDGSVRYCLQHATEKRDTEGIELAKILLSMSFTQRKKLARLA